MDPDGNVLATAKLDGESALAPNGHLSQFIDQIPPHYGPRRRDARPGGHLLLRLVVHSPSKAAIS